MNHLAAVVQRFHSPQKRRNKHIWAARESVWSDKIRLLMNQELLLLVHRCCLQETTLGDREGADMLYLFNQIIIISHLNERQIYIWNQ